MTPPHSFPTPSAGLPRVLRLPPDRSLLHRGPSARLLGLDPRSALVVDDLPPPLARMLDELVVPVERVGLVTRAVRRGADARAAEDLLRRLVDAGVLVDAAGSERAARYRAGARVAVVGVGRLAAGVAVGLALAGVGAVSVEVPRSAGAGGGTAADGDDPVSVDDLGTGLVDADRGRPRSVAIVDAVRRAAPGVRVEVRAGRAATDLCVLADVVVPEPSRVAALQRDAVAHLPVRLRDGTGLVGPLVLPGRSPCLGCVELHRRARDPGWPAVAAQLVDRPGRGTVATAAATAALGAAQALAALDAAGGPEPAPPSLGATLELDLGTGSVLRRAWAAHPDCTCGAPPRATSGPSAERGTIMG